LSHFEQHVATDVQYVTRLAINSEKTEPGLFSD